MDDFGVRFAVNDRERFECLRFVFGELKSDKDSGVFRGPEAWLDALPETARSLLDFTPVEHQGDEASVRGLAAIAVGLPSEQLGARWNWQALLGMLELGDYDLLRCELVTSDVGELHIDPHGYPYGGLGPLIGLVEAFGFAVLGVNECGDYESREQLENSRP